MSTYFFKTNINCSGCVDQIKPHLDRMQHAKDIEQWQVDVNDPEHILKIETMKLSPEEVKHQIRAAGFNADFTRPPNT